MRKKLFLSLLTMIVSTLAWSANYTVTIASSDYEVGYVQINIPKGDVDDVTDYDTDEGYGTISFTVKSGRQVTLKAFVNDASLYYFDGWSDGESEISRTITVKSDITLTANFKEYPTFTVNVASSDEDKGYVDVWCVSSCIDYDDTYVIVKEGDAVRIKATAASGNRFVRWDDNGEDNTQTERTITPTKDNITYTAIFEVIPSYTIDVESSSTEMGSVSVSASNYIKKGEGWIKVYENTSVTIKATPEEGYYFVSWDDESADNTKASRTITATENKTYKALFEKKTYCRVEVKASPEDYGEVYISANGSLDENEEDDNDQYVIVATDKTVNFWADAWEGYRFVRWDDDDAENNTKAERKKVPVTGNKTYTALFEVIANGTCGKNLTWSYDDHTLTISGTGEMTTYKYGESSPWEHLASEIEQIVLPEGLTTIGQGAFQTCENVHHITIPSTVTSIAGWSLPACGVLDTIFLKPIAPPTNDWRSVLSISGSSFCKSLQQEGTVILLVPFESYQLYSGGSYGKKVPYYTKDIYEGICSDKLTWTFNTKDSTLTISGTGEMSNAYSSTKPLISVPSAVKTLIVEEGVTSISASAFNAYTSLQSVTLPGTLTTIGNSAFYNCTNLKTVYNYSKLAVEKNYNYGYIGYYADNIYNYGAASGTCGGNLTYKFDFNTGVLTIEGEGAMADYNNNTKAPWDILKERITKVEIRNGVTTIGSYAFYSCTAMTEVTLPQTLVTIGGSAFYSCTALTEITLPSSLTTIESNAFYYCTNLKTVNSYAQFVVTKGSSNNGDVAYYADNANNLGTRTGSCGENAKYTFSFETGELVISGTGAMEVSTGESYTSWPWYIYREYIQSLTIGNGITSIGAYAFGGGMNFNLYLFTTVTIPASVETIESGAFGNNIQTVICLATTPPILANYMFTNATVYVPCASIDGYAIAENWSKLRLQVIDGDTDCDRKNGEGIVLYTYDYETRTAAVSGYVSTLINNDYVTIPETVKYEDKTYTVTSFSAGAFMDYKNLYSLTLPKTISTIEYAFYNCTGLRVLTVASDVDLTAFQGATQLDTVIVLADRDIAKESFAHSVNFVIGEEVKEISLWNTDILTLTLRNPATSVRMYSTIAPADKDYVYDLDGDGEMDFVSGVYAYSYLGIDKGKLFDNYSHYYDNYGKETSSAFYPFNANNDGLIDFYHNSEVYVYNEAYKSEVCESNGGAYKNTPIAIDYQSRIVLLDANLDGRMDFYSCEGNYDHFIHYRQPDGSYLKAKMQIIADTTGLDDTMKQWMYASDYIQGTYYVDGGIFGPQAQPGIFQSIDKTVDANHDGLIDLMSSTEGSLLLNLGNNRFIPAKSSGQMKARDFNGDGHSDYIIFDEITKTVSVQFFEGNGNYKTQVLLQNDNINHIWCYDFDNDGDVDVLLPLDWNKTSGYAFLVFFRNDGNNTFKKVENAFDEPVRHFRFMDCKDVDNDGKYEIIAADSVGYKYSDSKESSLYKGDYYIVRYDDKFKVSVDADPFIKNSIGISYGDAYGIDNQFLFADFNNDGKLDYWYSYDNDYALNHFSPNKVNTPPTKMNKPAVIYDEDRKMLKVSWDRGSDAETPTLDLTYNLRIGTKSGKGDIWFAAANADGSQRSILGGNAGDNLSQWVNTEGLATGDYYIAVQAVDPNNLGGAWSDEQVYHHTLISSQFEISNYEVTTTDTLLVQLSAPVNKDFTYNWNFGDDAVVLSQEGQNYKIAYNTSGVKTISLQVNAPSGASSLITNRTVRVFPVRFEYVDDNNYYKYSYFDMNMDGTIDRLMSESGGGFYRGDGSGTFTKLAKTYNTDLNPEGHGAMCFIDYNMDGLPDVLRSTNKGNLMLNENDYDLTFETHDFVRAYKSGNTYYSSQKDFTYYRSERLKDFNGDGYLDYYYNYTSGDGWLNYGYYLYGEDINGEATDKWTAFDRLHSDMEMPRYSADLNNDGLEDVLIYIYEDKMYCYDIYLQQTDGSFRKHGHVVLSDWTSKIEIADFNNDGYLDFIIKKDNRSTITVFFGDKNSSYSQTIDIHIPELESKKGDLLSVSAIEDIDNNGYIDLLITLGDWVEGAGQYLGGYDYEYMIIYMHPDYNILCQSAPTAADNLKYPFFDLNGDNVPDYNNYLMHSRITNDAPAVPKNLRMTEENGAVKLMWDAAVDKETPAAQMRYNISVKKKGAKVGEENAFIISPMNGLNDEATVIPDYPYKRGTQTYIPYRRFEVGQEYEFQIQSIDAWNAHSPMSAPITFTVQKNTTYNPDSPTGVEDVQGNNMRCAKVFRDGILYIECNGKVYSITGQEVR